MQPSPYTPGELAHTVSGRGDQLRKADNALGPMVAHRQLIGRVRVHVGPRGIGKTSLLAEIERRARAYGVLTATVEASRTGSLLHDAAGELDRAAEQRWGPIKHTLRDRLRTVTVGAGGFGVHVEGELDATTPHQGGPRSAASVFQDAIVALAREAQERQAAGVVLFVDEIQEGDPKSLETIGYTMQRLQRDNPDVPFGIFGAGLPNSAAVISAAATASERFRYEALGPLTDDAIQTALVAPASRLGVTWDPRLVDAVSDASMGYPHAVQLYGQYVWETAGFPDPDATLGPDLLPAAAVAVADDLDELFEARWQKASPQQRQFLTAMAHLSDTTCSRDDVAALMDRTSAELSTQRGRLIGKGLIMAPARSELAFTIPGFAAFVRERSEHPPPNLHTHTASRAELPAAARAALEASDRGRPQLADRETQNPRRAAQPYRPEERHPRRGGGPSR